MDSALIDHVIALLDKANADLEPELVPGPVARRLLASYARAEKLAGFGVAALARRVDEASVVARVTGTSIGKAKETIATSKALTDSAPLEEALKHGEISLAQATEIARGRGFGPRRGVRARGGRPG